MNKTMIQKAIKFFNRKIKEEKSKKHPGRGGGKRKIEAYRTKLEIISFFLKKKRWPSKLALGKNELKLAYRLHNYVIQSHKAHDPAILKLVQSNGRRTSSKNEKIRQLQKSKILDFVLENGRVPSVHSGKTQEEIKLGRILSVFEKNTNKKKDAEFLNKISTIDKCYKSGIQYKYRPLINASLVSDGPLVDMNKKELNGEQQ